ncbi:MULTISPECIES: SDR family oxidoreductase [Jeotgalicoccus]|uniref:SDR family oxidoreductase n=1 Tax=Jeotgalicoccus TaxID=227979 RepID=UPI00042171FB|nr:MULTISPECIES: SDR family oxidoreductase [Jeotgalicoccus]QQD86037.1 SDR family oxidoreductase [Jeotgalicoccus sp. ATCC 8456]
MDLTNKTYIVSGATTYLGREVALELATKNANIILAGLDYSELEDVKATLSDTTGEHEIVLLEQSKEIDWLDVVQKIEDSYESLNGIILVHSIFTDDKTVYNVSFNEFSEVMYEHVWGTYLGIRTMRPLLKIENDAKIINVIEPSFEEVFERNLYYTVTGAIEALTHSTAIELSREDVDVYALSYRPTYKTTEEERANQKAIKKIKAIIDHDKDIPTGETIIIS